MLKYVVLILTLLFSIYSSQELKSANNRTSQLFVVITTGDIYNPLNYSASNVNPTAYCLMGLEDLCAINVPSSDVYTALNAPSVFYIGKPRVMVTAGYDLADDIETAMNDVSQSVVVINGRTFYKKD